MSKKEGDWNGWLINYIWIFQHVFRENEYIHYFYNRKKKEYFITIKDLKISTGNKNAIHLLQNSLNYIISGGDLKYLKKCDIEYANYYNFEFESKKYADIIREIFDEDYFEWLKLHHKKYFNKKKLDYEKLFDLAFNNKVFYYYLNNSEKFFKEYKVYDLKKINDENRFINDFDFARDFFRQFPDKYFKKFVERVFEIYECLDIYEWNQIENDEDYTPPYHCNLDIINSLNPKYNPEFNKDILKTNYKKRYKILIESI